MRLYFAIAAAFVLVFVATSTPEPEDLLRGTGVEIVWTSAEINCGAQLGTGAGGCFRHETPNKIYVSPGMTKASTTYIVLHEYAHTLGLDECAADRYAVERGAEKHLASYLHTPACSY